MSDSRAEVSSTWRAMGILVYIGGVLATFMWMVIAGLWAVLFADFGDSDAHVWWRVLWMATALTVPVAAIAVGWILRERGPRKAAPVVGGAVVVVGLLWVAGLLIGPDLTHP